MNSLPWTIDKLRHSDSGNFLLISGPCAIEGREMAFKIAYHLVALSDKYEIPFIFKGSYRKANRTKLDSFTGIGDEKALEILAEISVHFSIPVTTDVHSASEVEMAAKYVDVIQIPAFLCRQTDILLAAGRSQRVVNIKKGQFLNMASMQHAIDKVKSTSNLRTMVTERGNFFGYQDLVVDFRGFSDLQEQQDVPGIMDCTHSLQKPNQTHGVTGGNPKYIATMARAALVTGARGIFVETHHDVATAKSDGANMLPLDQMEALLESAKSVYLASKKFI